MKANNKFSEQRAKEAILRLSLIPFFGNIRLGEITPHQLEQYKAKLIAQGISGKTIRNRLTVLHKCLSCAYEWLELRGSPPRTRWPRCPPSKTDYLSPDECELLVKHADGIVREMTITTLRTGMRQGEIKGLQWSSIDWETRVIAVRHSYCDIRKILDTPKSNKERYIPIDGNIIEMLHARKQASGFVFLDDKRPFNSPRLNLRLAKTCQRAGLRKITWHALRHTFASHLATRGVPLNVVQTLLGHASIMTTMRYAHVAPSTLRSAIEMLNPRYGINGNVGQPVVNRWIEDQTNWHPRDEKLAA
ncbi:site-specific integrase [Bradyrhizobium sp. CCBAU 53338]|uniref:tyrosine-type recombinase/integrase n=1 Tax=Bradyrhizobium sp. CCBAU 53338 TaxID=1325111 RepID=UPI00188D6E8D